MAKTISAVSVFCQDYREEVGGTVTLVGIMPDNIQFQAGGALPKVVVYTRIHLPADKRVKSLQCFLRTPDAAEVGLNDIALDLVSEALSTARTQGSPIAGIVSRIEASPFPGVVGRHMSIVRIDGDEYIAGIMNLSHIPSEE